MAMRDANPPVNYTFEVQAMRVEELLFTAEFTIGPRMDNDDSMRKFLELISAYDKQLNLLHDHLQGIIERETRVLAESMTMETIFEDTKDFLQKVSEKVQLELNPFGLHIYDVKVKQLVDGQKTQMEAADEARVKEANKAFEEIINRLKIGQKNSHKAHSAAAPSTVASTHIIASHADVGPADVAAATGPVDVGPAAAAGPVDFVATAASPVDVSHAAIAAAAAGPVDVGPAAVAAGPVGVGPATVVVAAAAAGPVVVGPAVVAGPAAAITAAVAGPAVAGPAVAGPAIAAIVGHPAIVAAAAAACCIIM